MTNRDFIEKFKNGATYGSYSNLHIRGTELINYQTVICYRIDDNKFALNVRKYSRSTSKIQNIIKDVLKDKIVEEYIGARAYIF